MLLHRIFVKSVLQGIVSYLFLLLFSTQTISAQVSVFQTMTTRDGLVSNYVFSACEDENGFLWLGTDKGLARYDGFRWQVFNTDHGLPGNYIAELYSDKNKGLWLLIASKGVYHYNTVSGALRFVTDKNLHHLTQTDKEGNLFYFQYTPDKAYVEGYEAKPALPEKPTRLFRETPQNRDDYLLTDFARKKIWLAPGKTARITDLASGWKSDTVRLTLVGENRLLSAVDENIFCSNKALYFINNHIAERKTVVTAAENTYLNMTRFNNQLVACNEKEGVYLIKQDGTVTHYTEANGLSTSLVSRAFVLKSGKLLFCTLGGGICYLLPEGNATVNTGGEAVKGLSQDGNFIYAVYGNTLLRFHRLTHTTETFSLPEKVIQGLDVWNGTVYISTLTGFSSYFITGNKLVKKETVLRYAGVSSVVETGNRLYAGTYGNYIVDYTHIKKPVEDTASFMVNEKIQLIPDGIAAYNHEDGLQLNMADGRKIFLTAKNGLPSNAVYHVQPYRDTLWISTKSGVAAYSGGKIVKTIGPQQGLTGERCIYTFHDKQNRLWILTDKYLGSYDGSRVITYPSVVVKDGSNDYVHTALFNAESNMLFTGTLKNLFVNNLSAVAAGTAAGQPSLEKTIVNGIALSGNQFSIPQQYEELRFVFHPFHVNPFTKARLLFRLEGKDEQFTELKDSLRVSYNKLRSGQYKLIAKLVNEDGVTGEETVLCSFTVKQPFWQKPWFIGLCLLATGLVTYIVVNARQKRLQRQKEKEILLERKLLQERERISRELHDNLGSSLVTIIAQSDNIETKLLYKQPEEALKKVQELGDQSRDTMNILRETIWAVQQESHSYESFTNRIRDFLQRTYSVTQIECSCEVSGQLHNNLSPEQVLHLFRCIQECTQNIIKHSGAGKAGYSFLANNRSLVIKIRDNGKGFDAGKTYTSNGIRNMHARIAELNGHVEILSGNGTGTLITFETLI